VTLSLPFYQLGKPLLGKAFSIVEILILLTAAGWLFHRLLALVEIGGNRPVGKKWLRGASWKVDILDGSVIALLLISAVSLLWAEHAREAAREFRTVVLEAIIFYSLLRSMIRRQQDAWQLADSWVLGAALIALVGVGQAVLGRDLITAEGVWRVRGLYGSPNNLALYLGRVFPLALAVAAWWSESKEAGAWPSRRWLYGLAALLMAAALFLTYSRGAWLVGVPAAILFLAAARGRRTFLLVLAILVVVALVATSVVGVGRLTSLLDTDEGTTFFRLQLWQSSWSMIRDHPLLGVGLDNFLYHYRTRYVLPTAWEEFNLSHPHNLLFDFWLRLGLPGLVVIAVLLVTLFRWGWRLYRQLSNSNDCLLVLGLLGGMVNFVAHGLVDNAFFLVDLAFASMLILAIVQFYNKQWERNSCAF
jgi:O-antigen ligase